MTDDALFARPEMFSFMSLGKRHQTAGKRDCSKEEGGTEPIWRPELSPEIRGLRWDCVKADHDDHDEKKRVIRESGANHLARIVRHHSLLFRAASRGLG